MFNGKMANMRNGNVGFWMLDKLLVNIPSKLIVKEFGWHNELIMYKAKSKKTSVGFPKFINDLEELDNYYLDFRCILYCYLSDDLEDQFSLFKLYVYEVFMKIMGDGFV